MAVQAPLVDKVSAAAACGKAETSSQWAAITLHVTTVNALAAVASPKKLRLGASGYSHQQRPSASLVSGA